MARLTPSTKAHRRPSGTSATSSRHAFDFAHSEKFSGVPARMITPIFVMPAYLVYHSFHLREPWSP